MADSEVEKGISKYESYFVGVLCAIDRMSEIECLPIPVLRQMLYLNVLDTFAGDTFPNKGNRERFVRFIEEVLDWEHNQKVCTPWLKKKLEGSKSISGKLYGSLEAIFADDCARKDINDDLTAGNLEELTTCGCEKKAIDACRFPNVIWDYRNSISHEFDIPSEAVEVDRLKSNLPYYLPVGHTLTTGIGTRELVLPTDFFVSICQQGLKKFMCYSREKNRNPYDARGRASTVEQ